MKNCLFPGEREGFNPIIAHGVSMGGHMASLGATVWDKPIVSREEAAIMCNKMLIAKHLPFVGTGSMFVMDFGLTHLYQGCFIRSNSLGPPWNPVCVKERIQGGSGSIDRVRRKCSPRRNRLCSNHGQNSSNQFPYKSSPMSSWSTSIKQESNWERDVAERTRPIIASKNFYVLGQKTFTFNQQW